MAYAKLIQKHNTTHAPDQIEALMRLEAGGTLDHLSPTQFKRAVKRAALIIDQMGPEEARALAATY